jgi:hypothetical protein
MDRRITVATSSFEHETGISFKAYQRLVLAMEFIAGISTQWFLY